MGAGGITPAASPVNVPQDVLVIQAPDRDRGAAADRRERAAAVLAGQLGPGFRRLVRLPSPRSFAYRWTLNGHTIAGATESSYAPIDRRVLRLRRHRDQPGRQHQPDQRPVGGESHGHDPARENGHPAGSQTSKPADLQLLGKARHLKARPGKLLTLKVRTTNQGDRRLEARRMSA